MHPCILYIEDNIENLRLIQRVLGATNYRLLEATTAQEGIALALKHKPDLILMDLNLSEMDGITATRHLRLFPEMKQVPIVALTANIMQDVLDTAISAGCNGYITKPIQVDKFLEEIIKYLGITADQDTPTIQ